VNQKQVLDQGKPVLDPLDKFGRIGMARIKVERPDPGANLELFALNPDSAHTVLQAASQSAFGLKAGEKNRRLVRPYPVFQPMSDAACVAHP